jgi:plastocyanin
MKKIVLLTLLIASTSMLFAKVIKIKVANFQFTNATVNAKVGDTIQWVWQNGSHTTTSTSVPAGAKTWDRVMDSAHRNFRYVLRVAGIYKYKCRPHASLGMKGTIKVTAALDAGLNSFSISDDAIDAILTWQTQSSKDIAYFSVQKSTDGNNFSEIAKVNPDLSNRYSFTDKNNNTSSKYVYYQVEMVDTKGNHDLTEIKMFTQKAVASKLITSLSPNPVSSPGHLMLQFNASREGTLLVQLYNQSGSFVKQTEMAAYKGLNNGHFHLGDLTPGTYYIVCTLGDIREKYTIIVK